MHANPILGSLAVAILWAASPIIHKHVFNTAHIAPTTAMILGALFFFLFMIPFAYTERKGLREDAAKLSRSVLLWLALASLAGGFLGNLLYYRILRHHAAYVVTAIMYSSPLFVALFGVVFLRERMSVPSIVGVVLIFTGICLLALHEHLYPKDSFAAI